MEDTQRIREEPVAVGIGLSTKLWIFLLLAVLTETKLIWVQDEGTKSQLGLHGKTNSKATSLPGVPLQLGKDKRKIEERII